MHLYGGYGSIKGRIIHIGVVRCEGKDYCKSEEEINQYLLLNNLAMLSN